MFKMRKPNQNQSTELYLEERLLIKILWECELLGNNDSLLLKGSSDRSKLNTSPTAYCSPLPPSPLTWKTLRASRLETQHPGGPRHRASRSSHAAAHSPGLPGPSGSGQALRWPRPLARLHLLQAPRTHRTTPLRLCRAPEAQLNAWPALPSVSSPLR